ncbi:MULTISPECIES: CocE/NonD family hydrolase [unclassified Rathayibacter]|uniref:CocE/NonD family hydrolase n=1 Tax=unclassified Rathayibacter TaxID=2609250 RepID=UPI000F49B170|nr:MULTISPECIES: CocE/NonD family hydrolase [unclassified Rathayibacter]
MSDITMKFDLPVPMRDGTVLRADVAWPAGDGPFPVLVERTPYDKNNRPIQNFETIDALRAGFIVVHQDTRGSGTSEGEWMPMKYERDDGYDTIVWAAALPNSNGRVGTFGASYVGSTQWSCAIAGAPALRAMAPVVTWSDPENGLMFRGGAVELGLNTWWGLMNALPHFLHAYPPETAYPKIMQALADAATLKEKFWELPAAAQPFFVDLGMPDVGVARALEDRSTLDDSRVDGHYEQLTVPSLNFAGWYDVFQQGSLDNYVGMRAHGATTRLIVGPWSHSSLTPGATLGEVGEVNFGFGMLTPGGEPISKINFDWYDHWLRESPATSTQESGVLIFVMGVDEWRAEADWPLARAVTTPLYLTEAGVLEWDAPVSTGAESAYVYDPADPVMTRGGNLVMGSDYPAGPFDQRVAEARDDVLVFTTPPLDQDIEITGRITATVFVATDGPSTDWVVRLCEVDVEGVSRNIVDGITRVSTEEGRVDEVTVDLWSTSILIRAGHRLRVQVTSSNFPRWDRNLNTGEPVNEGTTLRVAHQRILHDAAHPSRIDLPIIPA